MQTAIFLLVIFLVISHIRSINAGLKYDIAKQKLDKNYKGDHSLRFGMRFGRIAIKAPSLLKDDTTNIEIQKLVESYNLKVIIYYFILFLIGGLFLITLN